HTCSSSNQTCTDERSTGSPQASASITTPGTKNPHLTITKVATESGYSHVGDVINYTIVATNDGNTTLAAVTVSDPNATGLSCTPANATSPAHRASRNGTARHSIVQAHI